MNTARVTALAAVLATVWGVAYMHDRNHRYDVVAAGAGAGRTQDTREIDIRAFVIDHRTGKLWVWSGPLGPAILMGVPATEMKCVVPLDNKVLAGCMDSPAAANGK